MPVLTSPPILQTKTKEEVRHRRRETVDKLVDKDQILGNKSPWIVAIASWRSLAANVQYLLVSQLPSLNDPTWLRTPYTMRTQWCIAPPALQMLSRSSIRSSTRMAATRFHSNSEQLLLVSKTFKRQATSKMVQSEPSSTGSPRSSPITTRANLRSATQTKNSWIEAIWCRGKWWMTRNLFSLLDANLTLEMTKWALQIKNLLLISAQTKCLVQVKFWTTYSQSSFLRSLYNISVDVTVQMKNNDLWYQSQTRKLLWQNVWLKTTNHQSIKWSTTITWWVWPKVSTKLSSFCRIKVLWRIAQPLRTNLCSKQAFVRFQTLYCPLWMEDFPSGSNLPTRINFSNSHQCCKT